MLTLNGYKVMKTDANVHVEQLRKTLTVKPFIPSVFVANKNAIPRYKVYREVDDAFYVPKHFGIESFGPIRDTTRDVPQTDAEFWTFNGSIRESQQAVVDSLRRDSVFPPSSSFTIPFFEISGSTASSLSYRMPVLDAFKAIHVK